MMNSSNFSWKIKFIKVVVSKYGWGTQKDYFILYSLDPFI